MVKVNNYYSCTIIMTGKLDDITSIIKAVAAVVVVAIVGYVALVVISTIPK